MRIRVQSIQFKLLIGLIVSLTLSLVVSSYIDFKRAERQAIEDFKQIEARIKRDGKAMEEEILSSMDNRGAQLTKALALGLAALTEKHLENGAWVTVDGKRIFWDAKELERRLFSDKLTLVPESVEVAKKRSADYAKQKPAIRFDGKEIPLDQYELKFMSEYEAYADEYWQKYIDSFMISDDIVFALPTAFSPDPEKIGYISTHNTFYSPAGEKSKDNYGDTGLLSQKFRANRIFNDKPGYESAANKDLSKVKKVLYNRIIEGKTVNMWDLSYPLFFNGRHWGGVRLALSIQKAEEKLAAVREAHEKDLFSARIKFERSLKDMRYRMIISTVATLLVCSLAVFVCIAWFVGRPLKLIIDATKELSGGSGDLTRRLPIKTKDEMGALARHINLFLEQVQGIVTQIVSVSQKVKETTGSVAGAVIESEKGSRSIATAVAQVSSGSQVQVADVRKTVETMKTLNSSIETISSGAENQARDAGRASAIVSEMIDHIATANTSTHEVLEASLKTAVTAERGVGEVQKTIDGMNRIKETVLASARRLKELGEKSEQIRGILETVSEIAEQTNLLALNAAIEAARAGEHGKGFAVVAEEVRRLAGRSADAVKQIDGIVNAITAGTDSTIKAMDAGTREVNEGAALAVAASGALNEIMVNIKGTVEKVQHVSEVVDSLHKDSERVEEAVRSVMTITENNVRMSEDMASDSSRVMEAVTSVSLVSEQTAATAQEVASATEMLQVMSQNLGRTAQDLTKTSDQLHKLVHQFKV